MIKKIRKENVEFTFEFTVSYREEKENVGADIFKETLEKEITEKENQKITDIHIKDHELIISYKTDANFFTTYKVKTTCDYTVNMIVKAKPTMLGKFVRKHELASKYKRW